MSLDYSTVWVTIAAYHFQKTYDFYHQLLGQDPDRTQGDPDHLIYAEFHLSGLRLGLYRPTPPPSPLTSHLSPLTSHFSPLTSLSLCFQVPNLDRAIDVLTNLGYPIPGEILTPSHGREAYAFDPEGNRLILYEPKSPV